jgi:hypothetical protein
MGVVNKRGISAIVATVLMVLIAIAGISIVYMGILPMLNNADIESSETSVSVDTSGGYTLYDEQQKIACVQVKRESSAEIEGLKVLFSVDGNSRSAEISSADVPGLNQKRTYCFDLSSFGKPSEVTVVALPEDSGVAVTSVVPIKSLTVQALSSISGGDGGTSTVRYLDGDAFYYFDSDGDGYGTSLNYTRSATKLAGFATLDGDCNDLNPLVSPNQTEVNNNSVDENCDGIFSLSGCYNMSVSGRYRLENSIIAPSSTYCMILGADNVSFDLNGYAINASRVNYGVSVNRRSGASVYSGSVYGASMRNIDLYGSLYSQVYSMSLANAGRENIMIENSNYSDVRDVYISSPPGGTGLMLMTGSSYNLIRNVTIFGPGYGVYVSASRTLSNANVLDGLNLSSSAWGITFYEFSPATSGSEIRNNTLSNTYVCGGTVALNCGTAEVSGSGNKFMGTVTPCGGWPVSGTHYTPSCA